MLTFNEFVANPRVATVQKMIQSIPKAVFAAQRLFEPLGVRVEGLGRSTYGDMADIWQVAPSSFVKWVKKSPGVKMNWGGQIEEDEGQYSRVFFGLNNRLCKCSMSDDVGQMAGMIIANKIGGTSILDVCVLDIGFYVVKEERVSTYVPEDFKTAGKYVGMILGHIRDDLIKPAELNQGFPGSLRGQLAKKEVPEGVLGAFEIIMTALVTIYEKTGRMVLDIGEPGQPLNVGEKGGRPVLYDVSVQKVLQKVAVAREAKIPTISVLGEQVDEE